MKKTMAIYSDLKSEPAYLLDFHNAIYGALSRGPDLVDTNRRILTAVAREIKGIGKEGMQGGLYEWVKRTFTIASVEGFYGVVNPLSEDPGLMEAIW